MSRASRQVEAFLRLCPEAQETFMWLVSEWHGTVDELLSTVNILSQDDGAGEK
jgi:hypothetical protein